MSEDKKVNFCEFGLDNRLVKAIAMQGWKSPTLIQEKAIPLILDGRDVLVRARTGSGKTAAFAIPLLQQLITRKKVSLKQEIKALVLAPTIELCNQIGAVFTNLTSKFNDMVRCVDLASQVNLSCQKVALADDPDLIVSTPTKLLKVLKDGCLQIKDTLEFLIVDEADLMFSFGYENDFKELIPNFQNLSQSILASATLDENVQSMKGLILRDPVILKLNEPDLPPASQLFHYHIKAEELNKAAIIYALLKLNLITGKIIIFVNTVDKCYKLKLFLEQFNIASIVLNSELPANIRCHSVRQFNNGLYDIIIATDERQYLDEKTSQPSETANSQRIKDKESGVSRGIDFQFVSNIINFDFPYSIKSYVHRAGRTARGNNKGNVLSFVSLREMKLMKSVVNFLKKEQNDSAMLNEYNFKMEDIEPFRYRTQDAWRAATRFAVRESRLKEIKKEILNSKLLKNYFEESPLDLKAIRHDQVLHTVKKQPHLAHVPDYIVPPVLKKLSGYDEKNRGPLAKRKRSNNNNFNHKDSKKRKQNNPLFGIEATGILKDKKRKRRK